MLYIINKMTNKSKSILMKFKNYPPKIFVKNQFFYNISFKQIFMMILR
jgi:hypothetical protein